MKKRNVIISCLCFCLFGCAEAEINVNESSSVNTAEAQDVYIAQADLSDSEKNLLELVSGDRRISIWDYQVDDSIKTIWIRGFSLNDQGEWESLGGLGGEKEEENTQGRMAVLLDDLDQEQEIVYSYKYEDEVTGEIHSSKTSWKGAYFAQFPIEEGAQGYAVNDTTLTEQISDQEIPLVMLYGSKDGVLATPDFNDFENPEELIEMNYDYCYVITVEFSTMSLDEYETAQKEEEKNL